MADCPLFNLHNLFKKFPSFIHLDSNGSDAVELYMHHISDILMHRCPLDREDHEMKTLWRPTVKKTGLSFNFLCIYSWSYSSMRCIWYSWSLMTYVPSVRFGKSSFAKRTMAVTVFVSDCVNLCLSGGFSSGITQAWDIKFRRHNLQQDHLLFPSAPPPPYFKISSQFADSGLDIHLCSQMV